MGKENVSPEVESTTNNPGSQEKKVLSREISFPIAIESPIQTEVSIPASTNTFGLTSTKTVSIRTHPFVSVNSTT